MLKRKNTIKTLNELQDNTTDIEVKLNKNILTIRYKRKRMTDKDFFEVDLDNDIESDDYSRHDTPMRIKSFHLRNKILFMRDTRIHGTIVVLTEGSRVKFYKHGNEKESHPYSRLVRLKSRVVYTRLSRRGIRLFYVAYLKTKYDIPIKNVYLTVGDDIIRTKNIPVFHEMPHGIEIARNCIFTDLIKINPLVEGEPQINSSVGITIDIDGRLSGQTLMMRSNRIVKKGRRWYYAPISRTRKSGYSISLRRSSYGGLRLVRRPLESIEYNLFFRLYESTVVSFLMYYFAHIVRAVSKKPVNLYFEKFSSKAEEGAYDVFKKSYKSSASKNYFIIDRTSDDYKRIKDVAGVVRKFSLQSYWLSYRADFLISTEAQAHLNILRSSNKYVRYATYSQGFIFLQHGVTYLKAQDKNSSYVRSRESEPDYMIVNSEKEREVVAGMLDIHEERILNTGMPIFDKIKYRHINQKSPDIVTIMLTWKPYEENLHDFTQSTYYKTVMNIYNMLKTLIDERNIRIVAHPKVEEMLASTNIGGAFYAGPVSEILEKSKLLITDYSSVCYNTFYQGGAVIFYQPDLQYYEQENGVLIPNDSEYIGHRVFQESELVDLLKNNIIDGNIKLSNLRTARHEKNYSEINEHHDGKNVERIYSSLKKLKIV